MLTRFYADNFRCLVNFEFRPPAVSVLVGRNGSGKSTLLEGLKSVRDFLFGTQDVAQIFGFSKTFWETRSTQKFELEIEAKPGESYLYLLELDHSDTQSPRILSEVLTQGGRPLFRLDGGRVQLYNDENEAKGESFEFSTRTSALTSFAVRGSHVERFRAAAFGISFYSFDPRRMEWSSKSEARALAQDGSNLPSWLRTVSQENPLALSQLTESLRRVLSGFEQLKFRDMGDSKLLQIWLAGKARSSHSATLVNLSDGERCLVALYTVLHTLVQPAGTLIFDEPDNFVALDEIEPWVHALRDAVAEAKVQVIVASHHPDIVDYLAADDAFVLDRPSNDIARIAPFRVDRSKGVTASEELRVVLRNRSELDQ